MSDATPHPANSNIATRRVSTLTARAAPTITARLAGTPLDATLYGDGSLLWGDIAGRDLQTFCALLVAAGIEDGPVVVQGADRVGMLIGSFHETAAMPPPRPVERAPAKRSAGA